MNVYIGNRLRVISHDIVYHVASAKFTSTRLQFAEDVHNFRARYQQREFPTNTVRADLSLYDKLSFQGLELNV